jgi:hypothetical protein
MTSTRLIVEVTACISTASLPLILVHNYFSCTILQAIILDGRALTQVSLSSLSFLTVFSRRDGACSVHWETVLVQSLPHPFLASKTLTDAYRREYLALFGSLILVALEGFIRIITLGLRTMNTPFSPGW